MDANSVFSTTESTALVHQQKNINVDNILILLSVVPVCTLIITFLLIRRVIRRRRKLNTSIFFISSSLNHIHPISHGDTLSIERVTKRRVIKKGKAKNKHEKRKYFIKNILNGNQNNNQLVDIKFPREPVYKTQEKPSYILPFTSLPSNFDYSLANVDVHSDFVIIKDVGILQTYWYGNESGDQEKCKKQDSHNPNFT